MFIRYKRFGKNLYAYSVKTYWDSKARTVRQETKYLGKVIDKRMKKFEKVLYTKHKEKAILDFGDVYVLSEVYKRCGLQKVVRTSFREFANVIELLIFNRILNPLPMKSIYFWASGTWLSQTHNLDELESQHISRVLEEIGDESMLRNFFITYLKTFRKSGNYLFDITSLPMNGSCILSNWGYSDSSIDWQIKLALLIDKDVQIPVFFRLIPGNLPDVSSLQTTVQEAKELGIKTILLVLDRGLFSEPNLRMLRESNTNFIIPVPANNKIFKKLVQKHKALESPKNVFRFNNRILFGVKDRISSLWAYVILDPQRRTRELQDIYAKYIEKELLESQIERELTRKGFMILLSTQELSLSEALQLYYTRDFIEKCFRYFKSDLALIPLRRHNTATLAGYMLINFLALALYLQLKKSQIEFSLEEAWIILRQIKKKVYEDSSILTELTKEQKEILKAFNLIVPK